MNFFLLDLNHQKNAEMTPDKLVVKMITESAQLLSTALNLRGVKQDFLMKSTHENHPTAVWSRQTNPNLRYLADYGTALYNEYMFRFGKRDKFIRPRRIFKFVQDGFAAGKTTPFALCMPDAYKSDDSVKAYRNYVRAEKKHLFKWTKRPIPYFIYEVS